MSRHLADDTIRRQGQSSVIEHGGHPITRDARLDREQCTQLRVAVLLDDEAPLVRVNEVCDRAREWKSTDAHVVGEDALRFQLVDRLKNRSMAATERDDPNLRPPPSALRPPNLRRR